MKINLKELTHELKHHLPFTAIATVLAFLGIGIIYFLKGGITFSEFEELFHFAHPAHVLVSAMASGAMFYKYKRKVLPTIVVGITGAIIIGSLSDVIFPYLGGTLLGLNLSFHLPIVEETLIILSVALLGSVLGITLKITKIPHLLHVFISVFASLFYILAFSSIITPLTIIISFFIILISVIIPCCTSDIIFPFFFLGNKIKHCSCK
jgi:hypothetical protein